MMTDVNSRPLDDAYLEWLYNHFAVVQNTNPERSYWKLALQLYTTPFRPFLMQDNNRAEDGKELRGLFLDQTGYNLDDPYGLFLGLDCSMLEMLIALSDRTAFQTGGSVTEWFWRFMTNLSLERYSDDLYEISIQEEVEEALDRVNWRTYSADGTGGLFPLRQPDHDQRKIELWYQMSAYILEGLYVNTVPRF